MTKKANSQRAKFPKKEPYKGKFLIVSLHPDHEVVNESDIEEEKYLQELEQEQQRLRQVEIEK